MDTSFTINLTDLQLRNLAEHIPPDKAFDLGLGLGLTKTDMRDVDQSGDDPVDKTFQVLDRWRSNLDPRLVQWRNNFEGRQTEIVKLEAVMKETGLEKFSPCIDAHVSRDGSEGDLHTVNLSIPNGAEDSDRKQGWFARPGGMFHQAVQIDILAAFSSNSDGSDVKICTFHSQLCQLFLHPADSCQNWKHIRRIKSIFEPNSRLSNISLLPLVFTMDVVSLRNLEHVQKSIASGELGGALLRVMRDICDGDNEGGGCGRWEGLSLKLQLESESYNNGVRFFKDLEPPPSPFCNLTGVNGASQFSSGNFYNDWKNLTPKAEMDMTDTEAEAPDSRQRPGVGMVWRKMSQQNFGL